MSAFSQALEGVGPSIPTGGTLYEPVRHRPKAAKRLDFLRSLAGRAEAPAEWTWDAVIAEERRRTLYNTFFVATWCVQFPHNDRSRANQLLNLYLLLWRQRSRWCGPIPPRELRRLAERAPRYVEQQAEFCGPDGLAGWQRRQARDMRERLRLVASYALREPRPVAGPLKPGFELAERERGFVLEGAWVDQRKLVEREEVDCRKHERALILSLKYEAEKIADPSRRA